MGTKSFNSFEEIVLFIADALERQDLDEVADSCLPEPNDGDSKFPSGQSPRDYRLRALQALSRKLTGSQFREIYRGVAFPRDARFFVIGGHDKELGHVHIHFERDDSGWRITRLFQCR